MPIVLSGSLELTGSIVATGNFTTTGNITAQTLVVQTITSSINYITGSSNFGSLQSNRHTFTGSLYITGSTSTFSGCVGVGTSCSPVYALDVYNLTGNVAMRLFQPSALSSDYNSMYFTGNHTCVTGYIGSAGSTTPNASLQNSFYMGVQNAYPLKFATSDTVRATITSTGEACFACMVCTPYINSSGGGIINTTSNVLTFYNSAGGGNAKRFGLCMTNADTFKIYSQCDNGNVRKDNIIIANIDGAVGIGTATTSAEGNLFLGAQGTTEGGQLVLQKGTSYQCATHLDNYTNQFRILSGTDSATTAAHMIIDHTTKNACFYGAVSVPKVSHNGYNGATGYDLLGHFDAGSTNIATLSDTTAYTRVVAHIEWVSNYALAGTAMTMGYTIADTRRGNSNTIWVNCACTVLAYGDVPSNPTFGWSNGVLSVSVPGSTGLSARFRISSYAATITPNI